MLHLFFFNCGPIGWLLLLLEALCIVLLTERFFYYHREQINAREFGTGIKNVLRRENVMEALSICDATPGPVARLVKAAILNREQGKLAVKDILESAGLQELPQLEARLTWLATLSHMGTPLGLLGTIVGLIKTFQGVYMNGAFADAASLSGGICEALIATALGLILSITASTAYNYLTERMNAIILDMEKSATDVSIYLFDSNTQGK